jgi:hypothetical protein
LPWRLTSNAAWQRAAAATQLRRDVDYVRVDGLLVELLRAS